MSVAVVAEKPSVARDIAAVLGATSRRAGAFSGAGYVVTWAIGHLVGLAEPHQIRAEWKPWRWSQLPMVPREWPLVVLEKTRAQFEAVRAVLSDPAVHEVVCATDAGREGELIFRLVYEASGCRKPVRRLWISSLTEDAIRSGFRALRPSSDFDALASAANGRSRADWLVGMNLSRAYGLASDQPLSVGRVQTPTLAMVVERELAIHRFVPEDYLEVVASFSPRDPERYAGTWFREVAGKPSRRLPADGAEARAIADRVRAPTAAARVASSTSETKRMPPPLLYDLTELQRHANRLHGYSAQRVLQVAQALYEKHKLLTYPRTGSRHLSTQVAAELPQVVRAIEAPYGDRLAAGTGVRPLSRRFVDDSKVTDHHALIPTATPASPARLSEDERRIYDLVCRRLLSAWHGDFVWDAAAVMTEVHSAAAVDRFESSGIAVRELGWKVLDVGEERRPALPPGLVRGSPVKVLDAKPVSRRTQPPQRFTDATLLTAMETAGRALDGKELSDAMRETGLGTPATRAGMIETLLERTYLVRQGKALAATEKGIQLISSVDPAVKSPEMTGRWEARLQRIERGEEPLEPFMTGIESYLKEVIGRMSVPERGRRPPEVDPRQGSLFPVGPVEAGGPAEGRPPPQARPVSGTTVARAQVPPEGLGALLRSTFGFESFRPHQEPVCRAATLGADVLLVMPTGAGKSLCYQLPGIARGGTTLVVSPLIALMEDQVAKLRGAGCSAERIHSGRERSESRAVLQAYLDGALDFLFIAPERLRVPGFVERLAQRRPTLIAIDEAHCISQWGHDFRPDYRLLGERLPQLRPAPVIALTATATPAVQGDIVKQLGLKAPRTFIHGFRRHNIAVEVVELSPGARPARAGEILADPSRRPAIVYAPSRKVAESVAEELSAVCSADAYHAGLGAKVRGDIQSRFLAGKTEVIVATIAFGMGVDKPDVRTVIHLALPGSVEGYYQEIGRAGRDGKPSRAILLHSYADRRTHEFFHRRDYPEPEQLERIFQAAGRAGPKEQLRARARMDGDLFEKALEQLWIHGGVEISPDEEISRGRSGWEPSYAAQRARRVEQFEEMARFAEGPGCRMLRLVRYFGDAEDGGASCGACDRCAPKSAVGSVLRPARPDEQAAAREILGALRVSDGQGAGKLCKRCFGDSPAPEDRRRFDALLAALVRAGLVRAEEDAFEKEGRRIAFTRVSLTAAGRSSPDAGGLALPQEPEPKRRRSGRKDRGGRRRGERPGVTPAAAPEPLVNALKAWRLQEARRRRIPAFRILTDRTLMGLAAARPSTERELLAVRGIGPKLAETYGEALIALCLKG